MNLEIMKRSKVLEPGKSRKTHTRENALSYWLEAGRMVNASALADRKGVN